MKYGETDAKLAEDAFFEFRQHPSISQSLSQNLSRRLSISNKNEKLTDSERKYMKQHSDIGVGLLSATNVFEPITEQNEKV